MQEMDSGDSLVQLINFYYSWIMEVEKLQG